MRNLIAILAVAALAAMGTSCNKLQSRDHLNKGVQSFTNAQYPEAVEHFKTAVEHVASRLYPVADEAGLKLGHDWPHDFVMIVAPMFR